MHQKKTITLLLTHNITIINDRFPAGTEQVFLHDIQMLRAKGETISAYAGASFPGYAIKKLFFPSWADTAQHKALSILGQLVYLLEYAKLLKQTMLTVSYNFPLAAILQPAKTVVYFHYEQVLSLWSIFARRYQQSHYIFCSHFLLTQFLHTYPQIDPKRCTVIHNGIDTSIFSPQRKKHIDNHITFLYASAWVWEKGMDMFLSAVNSLPQQIHRRIQVIIASGPDLWTIHQNPERKCYIQEQQRMLKRMGEVIVLNGVTKQQLAALYSQADWLVFPSIWEEPFGLCALEAIACGCPVLTFGGGALPEILSPTNSVIVEKKTKKALAQTIERIAMGNIRPLKKPFPLLTQKNKHMKISVRDALYLSYIHTMIRFRRGKNDNYQENTFS